MSRYEQRSNLFLLVLVISSILFMTTKCIVLMHIFSSSYLEVSVKGFHIIAINYRMHLDFRDFKFGEKVF